MVSRERRRTGEGVFEELTAPWRNATALTVVYRCSFASCWLTFGGRRIYASATDGRPMTAGAAAARGGRWGDETLTCGVLRCDARSCEGGVGGGGQC